MSVLEPKCNDLAQPLLLRIGSKGNHYGFHGPRVANGDLSDELSSGYQGGFSWL